MSRRWAFAWAIAILVAVALFNPIVDRVSLLATLGRYEVVHIAAHTILYGALAYLARRGGLSPLRAAGFTLGVAVAQEAIQLVGFGRGPGAPELFDLGVDSVAVAAALGIHACGKRGHAAPSRSYGQNGAPVPLVVPRPRSDGQPRLRQDQGAHRQEG